MFERIGGLVLVWLSGANFCGWYWGVGDNPTIGLSVAPLALGLFVLWAHTRKPETDK